MTRLSSDWTLFYKIFLPNVWIVFFGVVICFLIFTLRTPLPFLMGTLVFYAVGIVLLWFTLIPLKRVEGTEDYLYVSNYFRTFKYTLDSIAGIKTVDMVLFKVVFLRFHGKTSFGKKIIFLARKVVWQEYINAHPELARVADSNRQGA